MKKAMKVVISSLVLILVASLAVGCVNGSKYTKEEAGKIKASTYEGIA